MMKKKKPVHYVDNKQLYKDLVDYITLYDSAVENNQPLPQIPNCIGIAIQKIASNLANRHQFRYYSFIDEMIFDAIENCILYIHKFKYKEYSNPFAYITQICFYAFIRRIQKEEKQRYIKMKLMKNSYIMNNLASMTAEDMKYIENMDMTYFDEEKFAILQEKFEKKGASTTEPKKRKGIEKFVDE